MATLILAIDAKDYHQKIERVVRTRTHFCPLYSDTLKACSTRSRVLITHVFYILACCQSTLSNFLTCSNNTFTTRPISQCISTVFNFSFMPSSGSLTLHYQLAYVRARELRISCMSCTLASCRSSCMSRLPFVVSLNQPPNVLNSLLCN